MLLEPLAVVDIVDHIDAVREHAVGKRALERGRQKVELHKDPPQPVSRTGYLLHRRVKELHELLHHSHNALELAGLGDVELVIDERFDPLHRKVQRQLQRVGRMRTDEVQRRLKDPFVCVRHRAERLNLAWHRELLT